MQRAVVLTANAKKQAQQLTDLGYPVSEMGVLAAPASGAAAVADAVEPGQAAPAAGAGRPAARTFALAVCSAASATPCAWLGAWAPSTCTAWPGWARCRRI